MRTRGLRIAERFRRTQRRVTPAGTPAAQALAATLARLTVGELPAWPDESGGGQGATGAEDMMLLLRRARASQIGAAAVLRTMPTQVGRAGGPGLGLRGKAHCTFTCVAAVVYAGCGTGSSPVATPGYKIKCKQDRGDCLQEAGKQCSGAYYIVSEDQHWGGVLADAIPAQTPWWTLIVACGTAPAGYSPPKVTTAPPPPAPTSTASPTSQDPDAPKERDLPELPTTKLAELSRQAVVSVESPSGLGSGFAVSQRLVATNLHVVAGQPAIRIRLPNGEAHPVALVAAYDPDWDLALLVVPTLTAHPLVLGDSNAVAVGERVVAVGNPQGLTLTVSEGIVSALRGAQGKSDILQTTAPISQGSSGGPLMSSRGFVVGLTTAYLAGGQALNFAIASSHLRALLLKSRGSRIALVDFADATRPQEQPKAAPAPAPPRLPSFPDNVAGFPMGLPVDKLKYYCPGFTYIAPTIVSCPYALVSLPFASAPVVLTFGAGQITSIGVRAHSRARAHAMLAERYGTPVALRQDKKLGWVPATSWPRGSPGAIEWQLEGGRIRLVSPDGKDLLVVFVSELQDRLSDASY
ncbi:MAG: trypsin-like peptidase domain-containing protein [Polyangiaceae bacterium]|nr:trypsin-like peptidase domain-containing protein [Polyangiaceae bacterium]